MRKIFDYTTNTVREVPASEASRLVRQGAASYQNDVPAGRDAANPPTDPASNQ